jgi:hypothetical protein
MVAVVSHCLQVGRLLCVAVSAEHLSSCCFLGEEVTIISAASNLALNIIRVFRVFLAFSYICNRGYAPRLKLHAI